MSASPLVTVLLPVWNGASLPLTAEGEELLRVAIPFPGPAGSRAGRPRTGLRGAGRR